MDTPGALLAFLVEESQTPECLTLEKSRVEFMGEDSRFVIEGLNLGLNELAPGYLNLTGLDIQVGRFKNSWVRSLQIRAGARAMRDWVTYRSCQTFSSRKFH